MTVIKRGGERERKRHKKAARDDTSYYNERTEFQRAREHRWIQFWIVTFSLKMSCELKFVICNAKLYSITCTKEWENITKKTIAINNFEYLFEFEKIKIQEFRWIGFLFLSLLVHRNGCHIIKHKLRPAGDITHKCTEIVYYFGKCCRWNMRSWQSSTTHKKIERNKNGFERKKKCIHENTT